MGGGGRVGSVEPPSGAHLGHDGTGECDSTGGQGRESSPLACLSIWSLSIHISTRMPPTPPSPPFRCACTPSASGPSRTLNHRWCSLVTGGARRWTHSVHRWEGRSRMGEVGWGDRVTTERHSSGLALCTGRRKGEGGEWPLCGSRGLLPQRRSNLGGRGGCGLIRAQREWAESACGRGRSAAGPEQCMSCITA